ncbi:MAG: ABC transporter substrate-binding protein [Treponema sp.]|jgi:NitT/TauT family transport system substrate-binding protein|nr:ABC transporter substrate-binding protein [Treponema sp.]
MKRYLVLCVLSFLCLQIHAFPSSETGNKVLTIYGIRGPSGLGMIQLFETPPRIDGFDVRIEALASSDLVAARFIAGEAQIGILPPDRGAKIASSGINIKAAAVIGMGMLSLLTSDTLVNSIQDLRGKTVEVAGQGTTPDYVFRRILLNYGLKADIDLRLGYSLAPPEIAQSLIAGRISTALIPEPFATMAIAGKPDLRHVADIQNEWHITTGAENYPMTVLAVNGNFAAQNPVAVSIILSALEDSIKWVLSHPAEAGILAEKHGLGFPSAAAAQAIPRSNYVFIPAREARASMEALFRVFLEFSPESIGGSLPADSFYLL